MANVSVSQILNDALIDLPQIVALVKSVEDGIAALNTSTKKPSDYMKFAAAVLNAAAPLADQIEAQATAPAA
jgi:hypothetical protein